MKRLYQTDPCLDLITGEIPVPSKKGTVSEVSTRVDSRCYCSYTRAVAMSAHKIALYARAAMGSVARPVAEFRLSGVDGVFVLHEKPDFRYALADGERVVVYSHDLAEKPQPRYAIPEVIAEPLVPLKDWGLSHRLPSKGWDPAMPPEVARLYGHLPDPLKERHVFPIEEIPPKTTPKKLIGSEHNIPKNLNRYYSKRTLSDSLRRGFSLKELLAELDRIREDPFAALQAKLRTEQRPENLEAKTAARITVQGMQVLDENGDVKFQAVYGPEALGFEFR